MRKLRRRGINCFILIYTYIYFLCCKRERRKEKFKNCIMKGMERKRFLFFPVEHYELGIYEVHIYKNKTE